MPACGLVLERVMQVGQDDLAPPGQAVKNEVAQPGGQPTQKRFRKMGQDPTRGFEKQFKHRGGVPSAHGARGSYR